MYTSHIIEEILNIVQRYTILFERGEDKWIFESSFELYRIISEIIELGDDTSDIFFSLFRELIDFFLIEFLG